MLTEGKYIFYLKYFAEEERKQKTEILLSDCLQYTIFLLRIKYIIFSY